MYAGRVKIPGPVGPGRGDHRVKTMPSYYGWCRPVNGPGSVRDRASQRLLADVFDLPHSRIAAIVKEFKARYSAKANGPDGEDD